MARGRKPKIGITPNYDYEKDVISINRGYCDAIQKSGGLGIILPLNEDMDFLQSIIQECDGFLLSGGSDVDAKYYGEVNLPVNGRISPIRDRVELFIAKKAIEDNKPVMGICRGIQIMNVAMGGSLYQDIYSQIKDKEILKHFQDAPKWYPTHEIYIEKGSRVREIMGLERLEVNSFHHQAVKDLAPGMKATSRTYDGIIESIEYSGHRFAIGVQWHPELMWQRDPVFLNLFAELVDEASKF